MTLRHKTNEKAEHVLSRLIAEQGVGPIDDLDELAALWPADDGCFDELRSDGTTGTTLTRLVSRLPRSSTKSWPQSGGHSFLLVLTFMIELTERFMPTALSSCPRNR